MLAKAALAIRAGGGGAASRAEKPIDIPKMPLRSVSAVADPPPARAPVEKYGVRLTFGSTPKLSFNGATINLTDREAGFLAAILPGFGQIVLTGTIVDKMGLPDSGGSVLVSDQFVSLEPKVLDMGLRLRYVPKMGYSIAKQ